MLTVSEIDKRIGSVILRKKNYLCDMQVKIGTNISNSIQLQDMYVIVTAEKLTIKVGCLFILIVVKMHGDWACLTQSYNVKPWCG